MQQMRERQGKQNDLGGQLQTGLRTLPALCPTTIGLREKKVRIFLSIVIAGSVGAFFTFLFPWPISSVRIRKPVRFF